MQSPVISGARQHLLWASQVLNAVGMGPESGPACAQHCHESPCARQNLVMWEAPIAVGIKWECALTTAPFTCSGAAAVFPFDQIYFQVAQACIQPGSLRHFTSIAVGEKRGQALLLRHVPSLHGAQLMMLVAVMCTLVPMTHIRLRLSPCGQLLTPHLSGMWEDNVGWSPIDACDLWRNGKLGITTIPF